MGHCSGGMKLAVTVAAAGGSGGATTPSTGTTTPTTGTTAPKTETTNTTHPSASVTLSPFIPLLISGVVAIFSYFVTI